MSNVAAKNLVVDVVDGTVSFRGAGGRVVHWYLSDIVERAESAEDPEVRAEWAQLARDARRFRAEREERQAIARSQRLHSIAARYGLGQSRAVARALAEYLAQRSQTTHEALVRAVADTQSISDADARALAMRVSS